MGNAATIASSIARTAIISAIREVLSTPKPPAESLVKQIEINRLWRPI
jgi:triphosphoribosyl-dephospho-CoA synthetase